MAIFSVVFLSVGALVGDSRGYKSTAILREERCKHSSFAGRRDHMELGGSGRPLTSSLRCFLS
jgi:hypothetical protein